MRDAVADAKVFLDSYSHGHVWPRKDGVRALCGGTPLCPQCRAERLVVDLVDKGEDDAVQTQRRRELD
jgi:hypothetical protein